MQRQISSVFSGGQERHAVYLRLMLVIAFVSVSPAWGQVGRNEAQRLLDEQRTRQREEALSRPVPGVAGPSAAESGSDMTRAPADVSDSEPSFLIREIVLVGDHLPGEDVRQALITPFLGLRLGPKRIDLLLRRITAACMDRGYVTTRAYLAPQNLASGRLEITLIPGVVESVTVNGQPMQGWTMAAIPSEKDASLRLADVEQTVDQINRLRSQRAAAQILPGQSPGGSIVAIDTHPEKPWRVSLGADNYGQHVSGENRHRLGLEADNLLGLWEAWNFAATASSNARSEVFSLSVPFGYGTASYYVAHANSNIALLPGVVITTDSVNQSLAWNHVVARNQQWRHALDVALTVRDIKRQLGEIELTPQHQGNVRLAENTLYRSVRGAFSGEIGYSRGLSAFGLDTDLAALPATAPHNQFEKWDANVSIAWALSPAVAWRTNLAGQTTRTGLLGGDQLFLGGAGSIRGFQEGTLAGDRGVWMRNELQWTNATSATNALNQQIAGSGARATPFLFLDASHSRLLSETVDKRLVSSGVGIRTAWKDLSAELAWGQPLTAPAGISRSSRLHFNVIFQL